MLGTARDEATPLLGRLEEQSLLTSLLDDVATRGQALVLRGEPGIGKSRLRAECERTSRERGRRGHTRAAACALDRGINGFGLPESVRLPVEGGRPPYVDALLPPSYEEPVGQGVRPRRACRGGPSAGGQTC